MGWHSSFHNAFASSLLSLLANKLTDLTCTEIGHVWNVDANLSALVTTSRIVQLNLNELGDNQLPEEWRPWVQQVTKLFYEVDDIIDGILLDEMKQNHLNNLQQPQRNLLLQLVDVQDQECTSNILSTLYRSLTGRRPQQQTSVDHHPLPPNETRVRGIILSSLKKWGLPHKISSLLKELQRIERQVDSLLRVVARNRPSSSTNTAFSSHLYMNSRLRIPIYSRHPRRSLGHARENDKKIIIEKFLLNPSFEGKGVCIVGMSGLGKTELAQSIRYDATINKHYIVIWNEPSAQQGHVADGYPSVLHYQKRILWILDDLWNMAHTTWASFYSSLGSNTMLLITTRDPEVATVTSSTPYYLKMLSAEDCKELILQRLPKRLRDHIGYRIPSIAKKCEGLPLVANLFSLVIPAECARKDPEEAISDIEEGDLWKSKVFRNEILPALRFDDPVMSPELGKFLAYMHLFPDDHEFKKDEQSKYWMAEELLASEQWTDENLSKAGSYFDSLLSRSMLYCSHYSKNYKNYTYKMHEFTNRFAQDIASNMCYQMNDGKKPFFPPTHTRHLSLCCRAIDPCYFDVIKNLYSHLRTFLLLPQQRTEIDAVPESFFSGLHYLRVVTLSRSHITNLPRSIGKLKHLRYLDASNNTRLEWLPDTICTLIGLRVLKLRKCRKLLCLPSKIRYLVNLVHLEVDITHFCSMPPYIGMLTNLQTLDTFTVKNEDGYRITELGNLNSLEGSLTIHKLENVNNSQQAKDARLDHKPRINRLELHWANMPLPFIAMDILNALQPNIERLAELRLINYNGVAFPSWLGNPSCRLKSIHLYNCPNIKALPPLWELPSLKTLFIDTTSSLVQLDRQFFGDIRRKRFPQLETLALQNMEVLTSWGNLERGDMPRLLNLTFMECPALSYLPSLRYLTSLENLVIRRCPTLNEDPDLPLSLKSYDFDPPLDRR